MIYRLVYRISLLLRKTCDVCHGRREIAIQVAFNENKIAYIGCDRCEYRGWLWRWQ